MEIKWTDGYEITVRIIGDAAVISANREGLLSLSSILRGLAEGKAGEHIHLDRYNSLEEGSAELILEKTEAPSSDE